MTVDELIDDFALNNEQQLREFAIPPNSLPAQRRSSLAANQGIAQAIDKTFSKIEVSKELSKTQRLLLQAKNAIKEQAENALPGQKRGKRSSKQSSMQNHKTLYGEEFVEEWYRNNHVEFENKLRQAIIDRFEDKNKLI